MAGLFDATGDSPSARARAAAWSRRALGDHATRRIGNGVDDLRFSAAYFGSPVGRASIRRLRSMRGRFAGERCFVIGNGPSLKRMDLKPLASEHTIGLNRIYLLFDEIGFATDFLVVINKHVIDQFLDEIVATPSVKFISHRNAPHLRHLPDRSATILTRHTPSFATSPLVGYWEGSTVTYVGMQLAAFLGFDEVILIGVDHSFTTSGPAHHLVTSTEADPNHFHPDYFGKGVRWQLPDLEVSEQAYRRARASFEARGKRIVDATAGGKLTVFPKVRYEDVIGAQSRTGSRHATEKR